MGDEDDDSRTQEKDSTDEKTSNGVTACKVEPREGGSSKVDLVHKMDETFRVGYLSFN
jgi:hypothetical protein